MPHPNAIMIASFYTAFQHLDAETMVACYGPDATFFDPVFGQLHGAQVAEMWRMLTTRAIKFSLAFNGVEADDRHGKAHWTASYTFAPTGRTVVNEIDSSFTFRDGKIVAHIDRFNLWKWARQALGSKGWLLGWSQFLQQKIRDQAAYGLRAFSRHQPASAEGAQAG
jgi:ketosteroid isomerase-like protein